MQSIHFLHCNRHGDRFKIHFVFVVLEFLFVNSLCLLPFPGCRDKRINFITLEMKLLIYYVLSPFSSFFFPHQTFQLMPSLSSLAKRFSSSVKTPAMIRFYKCSERRQGTFFRWKKTTDALNGFYFNAVKRYEHFLLSFHKHAEHFSAHSDRQCLKFRLKRDIVGRKHLNKYMQSRTFALGYDNVFLSSNVFWSFNSHHDT